jgi:hypothetical protein
MENVKDEDIEGQDSGIEAPKKERKPYVLTEKRKEAFEKARTKRQENIEKK